MGAEHASTEAGPRGDVAVLGAHTTPFASAFPGSIAELVLGAVEQALAAAGVDWTDIDAVVTASVDLFDGLTASNIAVTEVVGAVHKPETRIAADGLAAAIHAIHQIRAEAYETVLVVAHGKASMSDHWGLTAWTVDPVFLQPLGVDALVCAGLQAALVARGDQAALRRWADVTAARIRSAGGTLTPEAVLESPEVATPIRASMVAPLGDGACAVVLGAERAARGGRRVVVTATSHDIDLHHPGVRDLSTWEGLRRACDRAYAAAGIGESTSAFNVVEPSCMFPHEEELFLAAARIDAVTSPTGGLFAGTAPVISGLTRLVEAARAIGGHPGHRALAHGTWGPAGQAHAVAVLESR